MTEQDKTLKALQTAIQMEIDGKQYYIQASQESGNEMGKKLFQSLAVEEDIHRQKFEQIYEGLRNHKAWPEVDYKPQGGQGLRTIFAVASEKLGANVAAPVSELEAIQMAMDMENKTFDFYKAQSASADQDSERDFFNGVANEEREHHLVLLDYFSYLKDPTGWFVSKERSSLDGG
ncbi:ferritin family protein [Chloroflexota bacterium]